MKQFKRIYIEIGNLCNLSCSFCPKSTRPIRQINAKEFCHILKEITPYTDYVYLHIKGEPLLHPQLEEILFLCKEYNLKVNITTNGFLLSDKKSILLNAPCIRQISISLHSFEDFTSNLEKHKAYLRRVITTSQELEIKTPIIISLRLWNLNKTDSSQMSYQHNLETLQQLESAFSLEVPILTQLATSSSLNKGIPLSSRIFLNQDYQFTWPALSAPFVGDTGYCYGLKNQLGILSDGTIVPCCLDGEGVIPLGNIFTTTLSEVLSSHRTQTILHGFSQRKVVEPLCKHCGYRNRFNH